MLHRANRLFLLRSRHCFRKLPLLKVPKRSVSTVKGLPNKDNRRLSKTAIVVLTTTGTAAGLILYMQRTSRLELFNYAENYRKGLVNDLSWFNCVALGLIDLYRQPLGPQILRREKSGRRLARWATNKKRYNYGIFS